MKSILLKINHSTGGVSLAHPLASPGVQSRTISVKEIRNVPEGVTPVQVARLWSVTADCTWLGSPDPMGGGRFVFEFSELGEGTIIMPAKNAAATLGAIGGKAKSPAKTATARANGRKGGRPSNLSEFLRGFGETCGRGDADAHWAAYSRQLPDRERAEVERGGYDAGKREGLAYRQL